MAPQHPNPTALQAGTFTSPELSEEAVSAELAKHPKGNFVVPSKKAGEKTWFRGSMPDLLKLRDEEYARSTKEWGAYMTAQIATSLRACTEGFEGCLWAVHANQPAPAMATKLAVIY